ncbi:MAG: hypothetical protein ACYTGO_16095 [Planctomycetota bacterium]|jgi:hypothetical protein
MAHTASNTVQVETSERGMTLVETSVVAVLTIAILGFFYSGTISVSAMTIDNSRKARSDNQRRDIFANISAELAQTGKEGRFTVQPGGHSIIYTKLIGAARDGVDVSGVWSQTFSIVFDAKTGTVSRKEGQASVVWATGVKDLTFTHKPGDSHIDVRVVTEYRGQDFVRTIQVYPRN